MCHPHSHCNAADLILITQHGVPAVPITVQLSKNISSLKIYYSIPFHLFESGINP